MERAGGGGIHKSELENDICLEMASRSGNGVFWPFQGSREVDCALRRLFPGGGDEKTIISCQVTFGCLVLGFLS